ncbi:MAG: hypothetical protein ACXABY_00515 [Candidatus Thorarchaeota archaeon]|jgi:hypothetical protein
MSVFMTETDELRAEIRSLRLRIEALEEKLRKLLCYDEEDMGIPGAFIR